MKGPLLVLHQRQPPLQIPASQSLGLFSLHFALLPLTPPNGPSEIGACGPGRGRARAGLWGGSPGPSAVPGVVAAPPLPRRRLGRPAAPRLRHSRKGEGR